MDNIKKLKLPLNNGVEMPVEGFGTFLVMNPEICQNIVYTAIKTGYRLIDTAQCYNNEEAVGKGVQQAIDEGLIRREDIFITTKVWFHSYEPDDCRKSINESMKKLDTDYLDMVLLHWPYGNVYAAWRVLEEYYEAGRVRAIGVSNMEADRLIDLINFNCIKPAVDQIEANLYCQRQEERKWLKKYDIVAQAYAPLGQGKANEMFNEPFIKCLAEKYCKTSAQILLRFLTQIGLSIIPKSVHEERIRENIDIFDFELTNEEIAKLQSLDRKIVKVGSSEDPETVEIAMTW
jgi:2,5-diketo-D-gluconate reductase A